MKEKLSNYNEMKLIEENIDILNILLLDQSSKENIKWCTDNYKEHGSGYLSDDQIKVDVFLQKKNILKPRILKSKAEQRKRSRDMGEVFTPSWICNEMLNRMDEEYFHKSNVFNIQSKTNWKSKKKKINFLSMNLKWEDYVKRKVLEITCGEAPFLASRYDAVTGNLIEINKRIGALDRKLRVINENVDDEKEWLNWTYEAYKSIFGYEMQGDNVLIARENLLFTFVDYYIDKFKKEPIKDYLLEIAYILSWNIWQMDGLKYVIPNSCKMVPKAQASLFDEEELEPCQGCVNGNNNCHTGVYCQIMDWNNLSPKRFYKGDQNMKFDFIIGNPPYQETINQTKTQTQGNSVWIYPYFQFEADKICKCSCLIYPFGGWFDAPSRLGGLGDKILKDGHTISIQAYEGTSDRRAWYRNDKLPNPIFGENANLSAGVSIVIRSDQKHESFKYSNRMYSDVAVEININETEKLTPNPLCIDINKKLGKSKIDQIIKKGIFGIESNFVELNPEKVSFDKDDWKTPIQLLTNDKSGSSGRARLYYTDVDNIPKGREYIKYYKVIMTSAYPKQKLTSGCPTIENVKKRISEIVEVLQPNSAFGRSRLSLFMSLDKSECDNFMKYIKTNFFASLVLQEPNRRSSFGEIIPNQDFSSSSDIDWNQSIEDIDKQLFKKYNLSEEEISFLLNSLERSNKDGKD